MWMSRALRGKVIMGSELNDTVKCWVFFRLKQLVGRVGIVFGAEGVSAPSDMKCLGY
jgi:hypothetical protein